MDVYGDTGLVADSTYGRILLFGPDLEPRGWFGFKGTARCQIGWPMAAALNADGHVLVLDRQRALVTIWDPTARKCLGEFSGFGNAPGALYRPNDLTLDPTGRIYITPGYEARIQVFK